MREFDLVCIGSGPAGEKAATQAGYFGHSVAVVEREPHPGGAMVNTGTIPSKALRETALLCSALRRRPLPGVNTDVSHELSIHRLMAQRYRVQYQEHDRIEKNFDREGVEVFRGQGRIVDRHTVGVEAVDGSTVMLKAKNILIATGSSPVRPDYVPFNPETVVDAEGLLELEYIPDSVVVVGGGVIGSEYACILSELGVHVTLIDPRDSLLGFLDGECRDHLVRAMTDNGIDIRLNSKVTTVTRRDDGVTLKLDDETEMECDLLLWAAGRQSNSDDIGIDVVGVETGRRGLVLVNEAYQTNIPNIYAAGDVIGFPALSSTSMEQGRIAACHMFDIPFKKKLAETVPIGLYTIPAVSMVGLTEAQAREKGYDAVTGKASYRHNARGRMLGDEQGLVKCVFDRANRRLLGVSIVGEDATELVHLGQCMIGFEGGIDDFIGACFNYPSLSELYKYAAYHALGKLNVRPQRRSETESRAA